MSTLNALKIKHYGSYKKVIVFTWSKNERNKIKTNFFEKCDAHKNPTVV